MFANHIAAISDPSERAAFVALKREEHEADVGLLRLASELVFDAVVDFPNLRNEVIRRFASADPVDRSAVAKRHGIPSG